MALPTGLDQQTLDYEYRGEPFGGSPTKSSIDLQTLDYEYRGEPFFSNNTTGGGGGGGGATVHSGQWLAL